jgi:hypothetical protein
MNAITRDEKLLTPQELLAEAAQKANLDIEKALAAKRRHEEELSKLHETFIGGEIGPEAPARVNAAVRSATEQGHREALMLRFPSDWCTDGGRAINNDHPDWPQTLDGIAKRGYVYWETHLEPLGYKTRARILDYPGGKPGDVGLFLVW